MTTEGSFSVSQETLKVLLKMAIVSSITEQLNFFPAFSLETKLMAKGEI